MQAIKLSNDVEQTLTRAFGTDLGRAALEALAIEGYRSARLSVGEVARILGLETSLEAQSWLSRRGVALNYSLEDLEADRATMAKLFPEKSK